MNKLTQILTGMAAGAVLYFAPTPAVNAQEIEGKSTAATLFGQECVPGKSYLIQTVDGEYIKAVCKTPEEKKNDPCSRKFERNGIRVGGDCKDAREYVTKGDITAVTEEIRKVGEKTDNLEKKVNDSDTKIIALEQDKLTEVERFYAALGGELCNPDVIRLKSENADYKTKVGELRTAETALQDYTASLSIPTDETDLTPRDLLTKELASEKSVVDKKIATDLLQKVEEAEKAVQKAKQVIDQDIEMLKKKGCGYTTRKPKADDYDDWSKKPHLYARALAAIDFNGNWGGKAEFGVDFPLREWLILGSEARIGYLPSEESTSETKKFPSATEYIQEETERVSIGDVGGALKFRFFKQGYLNLKLALGASFSGNKVSRKMTVGEDTRTHNSDFELETDFYGGAGLEGKIGKSKWQWVIETMYLPAAKYGEVMAGFGRMF